jgi:hypothetical protein
MSRLSRLCCVLLAASIALAAPQEKWYDAYKRGVSAVNAKGYRAAADALQKSIAEMPSEAASIRAGNEIILYVPHFWLGIAKFNLGDVDGALREWRTSEDQGVIAKTEYYSRLKDWVSRAQMEKQRNAETQASASKKQADAAISKALAVQVDALSAGGDRSESYRSAQKKLQDALSQFHDAGTDVNAYAAAEQTAQQATALFTAAAEEGKKLRAARQTVPATPKPQTQPVKPPTVMITNVPPATTTAPAAAKVDTAPPPPPVESEAEVSARVAVQQYRRSAAAAPKEIARVETREADRLNQQLLAAKTDADFGRIAREATDRAAAMAKSIEAAAQARAQPVPLLPATTTIPPAAPVGTPKTDLSVPFRAYAEGDLEGAEQLLTLTIQSQPSPEAWLLRGCVRYTRAMLSRDGKGLLVGAESDFRSALAKDRALRLDRRSFSPKLIAFFEDVRQKL